MLCVWIYRRVFWGEWLQVEAFNRALIGRINKQCIKISKLARS